MLLIIYDYIWIHCRVDNVRLVCMTYSMYIYIYIIESTQSNGQVNLAPAQSGAATIKKRMSFQTAAKQNFPSLGAKAGNWGWNRPGVKHNILILIESLLRLGLSEVAQNLHTRSGTTLHRYPIGDTSGDIEILTTNRGRP